MQTSKFEIKKRLHKTLIKYSIILGIALVYLVFVLLAGFGIPCLFYEITGLKCPGCGITKMFISLSKLDFSSAFWHNPFLFVTGPFLVAYLACSEAKYIRTGSSRMGKWEIFVYVELIMALVYAVLRNILPM